MARKKIDLAAAAGNAADDFVSAAPDAKPKKEALSLLTVQIPVDVHKALKMRAAEKGTSMKELLLDLIGRELSVDA